LRQPATRASIAGMGDYQCWFCGQEVEEIDNDAVMVSVENLWNWRARHSEPDAPVQAMFAHSTCAKDRMRGATMELDPRTLRENAGEL